MHGRQAPQAPLHNDPCSPVFAVEFSAVYASGNSQLCTCKRAASDNPGARTAPRGGRDFSQDHLEKMLSQSIVALRKLFWRLSRPCPKSQPAETT